MRPTILVSLLFIPLVPACATETPPEDPVPFGVEPQQPCAAVGYPVDDSTVQDRYDYAYDDDGRETWFQISYAGGTTYRRARFYRDGLLDEERIATPTVKTTQSFGYDDGLPSTGFFHETVGSPEMLTIYWQEWQWREDGGEHAALAQFRRWVPSTDAETVVRYEALAGGEDGFRQETCTTGAGCAVVEYVGPHAYVGDTRTWTELRRDDGRETRVFDERGLIVSHARHDRAGVLVEETTWRRDDDGTMRAWERDTAGQPSYRYEPQYQACP
ncbi:MAG TPA: hypothetical protein VM261_25855 [Kofleriaceae bacterium]|nr:hypothetical protein [Kofleriaceae bacterium]